MTELVLHIQGDTITLIYNEQLDLRDLGQMSITRASDVNPDEQGHWWADLWHAHGPRLGPFDLRSQALAAEVAWLQQNLGEK